MVNPIVKLPVGTLFGKLTVTSETEEKRGKTPYIHTVCNCGTERTVAKYSLTSGNTVSCGSKTCMDRTNSGPKSVPIPVGSVFSKLTVVSEIEKKINGNIHTQCVCSCGEEKYAEKRALKLGSIGSCGKSGCSERGKTLWATPLAAGSVFGKLTVVDEMDYRKDSTRRLFTKCRCFCGVEKLVDKGNLRSGLSKSCGCVRTREFDIEIGNTYGDLTVIGLEDEKNTQGESKWNCLCFCGNNSIVDGGSLVRGNSKSCGCASGFNRDRPEVREGIAKTRLDKAKTEMTNKKFGMLTVKKFAGMDKEKGYVWECLCDCGRVSLAKGFSLKAGDLISCGCARSSLNIEDVNGQIDNSFAARRLLRGIEENKTLTPRDKIDRVTFRRYSILTKERDNYVCFLCGVQGYEGDDNTRAHHIFPWRDHEELRFEMTNLATLCHDCHVTKAHKGGYREDVDPEIQTLLQKMVSERYPA